ncbi:dephospho-CoA kinase [Snodgrassella alvi]|uniref:Dephospho-CoA kinase n=1 Tax=Snodgrassella alvi TaxID=1196083 RepID=A0A2N9XC13_9NEIS|nr:dephospho-CoA kinase [Snodgrassella alvi]PIT44186.1 dephospho-CoA kinase [Snodgrassella alvi]
MTFWVGLSGGIGSGKSTAASCFAAVGVPVLNADDISRQLTAPQGLALPAIRKQCGQNLFLADGSLDRQQLRNWVFADSCNRILLENILHPLIWQGLQQAKRQTSSNQHYGIIEIPLLAEKPEFQQLVQRILIIEAPVDLCIQRVQQRSSLDETTIRAIMAQQIVSNSRKAIADDIIINDGNWQELNQKVIQQHDFYQALTSPKL